MSEELIIKYLKRTWKNYKSVVGLPPNYSYLHGNPIKVHVPIDISTNGLMIIGAYPTAHFNVIEGIRDVPVEDHLYPFSNEKYFDGASINNVKSGAEIEDYFLSKLNLKRESCWITDLVKVFLFKEGHIKKYQSLGYKGHQETRSHFLDLAKKSVIFINEEIELAKPKVILGLGSEVNSVMLNMSEKEAQKLMLEAKGVKYQVNEKEYHYFPVPHPGILMRGGEGSAKWREALDRSLEEIKRYT
jgi:uracil-DNA glycosylase